MKKKIKRVILISLSVFCLLAAVLAVHIYMVTRPKAPTATTRIMARMDLAKSINSSDSTKILSWLYSQKGIDHVLCNPATGIVVFTFYPVQTNADAIVANFNKALDYGALRHMPSAEALENGCPVATTSMSYKFGKILKKLF